MPTVYQTKATAKGGRNGTVVSEDGVLNLEVRVPKSMGGPGGEYTNPEQLFAAGYAACFDSALNFVAKLQRAKIDSSVTATVGLQMAGLTSMKLAVSLDVEINGVDRETARRLLEKAHATCPYSNALRNNVDVKLNLVDPTTKEKEAVKVSAAVLEEVVE